MAAGGVSAGGRWLLCHQGPLSYSRSVTIRGALVQTNRQRQLLASKPAWGQEHSRSSQGPHGYSSVLQEEAGAGQMQAAKNRWLLESHWKEAKEGCSGDKEGLNLRSDHLVALFQLFKNRHTAKRERRQTKKINSFKYSQEHLPMFLALSPLTPFFSPGEEDNVFFIPEICRRAWDCWVSTWPPAVNLALCQGLSHSFT